MGYVAWSVVFGEQPSAAKWNILGQNDAAFNDGSGIGNNVVGSRALVATIKDIGDSSADFGTSNTTLGSISVPAGTWLFIFKVNINFSVAQDTYVTGEIYNSTDAIVLDTGYSGVDYPGGTTTARVPMTVVTVGTLGGTKTIISRVRANDSGGTSQADSANLIAVPVGV